MNAIFQSFDDTTDPSQVAPGLASLRAEMAKRGLDGFLVPRADEHQGEYVPKRAERLAWLTAFTGSAGLAAVMKDKAALFVDGRYTLQAKQQTDTKLFETADLMGDTPLTWIEANLTSGAKLGYDSRLHTQAAIERLRSVVERVGASLVPLENNPLDAVWKDQPAAPDDPARVYATEKAGESSQSKRDRVGKDIVKRGADAAVLTLPDSICWLLNIRGSDVPHTPFVLCFAILHADGKAVLFVNSDKIPWDMVKHLGPDVRISDPSEFAIALQAMKGKKVIADPATAGAYVFDQLTRGGAAIVRATDPCLLPKACKNTVEIEGMRRAHIRDGQALTRFLAWLAREAPKGGIDEIEAVEQLETFRRDTNVLKDISFDSISGAGPNGAVVHYRVTRKTNRKIEQGQLFLIDSGAQYEDGTTDVTRTVAIGTPSPEMRDRFTRVLKGHIALATAKFPEGTNGAQLDSFARRPLWDAGLDYGHGTGHGVGSYLSVHEGPQSISPRGTAQALLPGMICSNEPGYYQEGAFGIRIENLVVVNEVQAAGEGRKKMLGFETITLAPIDLALVESSLLSGEEREWLNAYHGRVRDAVSPALAGDAEASAWLAEATRAI
jgi:Xaa-Pro aminopeptidase